MTARRTTRIRWELDFEINDGETNARFKDALRVKTLVGTRCAHCAWVFVPPRPICERCFAPVKDWVDVPAVGTLVSFSVVHIAPGKRETPFVLGVIRLEGADGLLLHYLHAPALLADTDVASSVIGRRVEAVWREETVGELLDIVHFQLVGSVDA